MHVILLLLANVAFVKSETICDNKTQYDVYCNDCMIVETCAALYHITYSSTPGACSATDKLTFESMFHHLWSDRAYGLPSVKQFEYCDKDAGNINYKALLLYYQWGPSCNDGETFEMYPDGQSGFCYCGTDCDKTYSNPPMNSLLTTLVVIIGTNIVFNIIVLILRYRDNRQSSKNTISTTGTSNNNNYKNNNNKFISRKAYA